MRTSVAASVQHAAPQPFMTRGLPEHRCGASSRNKGPGLKEFEPRELLCSQSPSAEDIGGAEGNC
eukprot:2388261-Alexandrium_andersonii.AAC.1